MKTTYTFKIYQYNELKKEFNEQESDQKAFAYLLRSQGQSTDWALRYGNWKVEQINEQTKESEFWKPTKRREIGRKGVQIY